MARRKPGRMSNLGEKAYKKTEQELAEEEVKLLLKTSIDWEALRPKITNATHYDELIKAVNDSTQRNESVAQLSDRLKQLGNESLALAKKVVKLLA